MSKELREGLISDSGDHHSISKSDKQGGLSIESYSTPVSKERKEAQERHAVPSNYTQAPIE